MRVRFDYPDEPVGILVDWGGLSFKNGHTVEVTIEDQIQFSLRTNKPFAQAVEDSPHITIVKKKSEVIT